MLFISIKECKLASWVILSLNLSESIIPEEYAIHTSNSTDINIEGGRNDFINYTEVRKEFTKDSAYAPVTWESDHKAFDTVKSIIEKFST